MNLKSATLIGLVQRTRLLMRAAGWLARRRPFAGLAAFGILAADGVDADVAELAVEEAVIGAATELAVGREPEADAFLKRDRVLDGLVFRGVERLAVDLATAKLRARSSSSLAGRNRLPMCSARNGGSVSDGNAFSGRGGMMGFGISLSPMMSPANSPGEGFCHHSAKAFAIIVELGTRQRKRNKAGVQGRG